MKYYLGFSIPDTKTEIMDQNTEIPRTPQLNSHVLDLPFPHSELKM